MAAIKTGKSYSEQTKRKQSLSKLRKPRSPEVREKISKGMKGNKKAASTKNKIKNKKKI
jgi:hypothetical protein